MYWNEKIHVIAKTLAANLIQQGRINVFAKPCGTPILPAIGLCDAIRIGPDVAYFESKENLLTQQQKNLLQDFATICDFKATSDLPQWMTNDELGQLRAFLNTNPKIKQVGRYTFQIDDRMVDFTSATSMPKIPKGLTALWAAFLGWLGGRHFVLRIFKMLDDNALRKRRASL